MATQLSGIIRFHDVLDAEAFVRATLNSSGIPFAREEFEELVAEGLCLLAGLAARYEPHRAGYVAAGRFSGYAARFLPRRLGDAWHRMHPEHLLISGDDGKRHWQYRAPAVSLTALQAGRETSDGMWEQGARGIGEFREVPLAKVA